MSTRILIADDEKEFLEILAERLRTREFEVLEALDGEQAVAKVAENEVDVAILDVLMPNKDGLEALREIKAMKPLVEVLMLTGHATVETAIEGMKLGAYDYLMKPAELDDLVAKINRAAKRKSEHEDRIQQAEISRIVKTRGW